MKRLVFAACCAALAPIAHAAGDYPAALPSEAVVRNALVQFPQVRGAQGGIALSEAERARLRSGPYEWTVRGGAYQRSVAGGAYQPSVAGGARYQEQNVTVERPLRWFGKADKDAALGEQGVLVSTSAYADAWQQAGRLLLATWFNAMREQRAAARLAEQLALTDQLLASVQKRFKAGDAPRLESMLIEAERERVSALQQQAAQRAVLAAIDLEKKFSGIPPPTPATLGLPSDTVSNEDWVAHILSENDELQLAQAEVQQARLRAERAGLNRKPDPSIGAYAAREIGGRERIIGVILSIPLPSAGRSADYAGALARENIAAERLRQVRAKVESDAQRVASNAGAAYRIWTTLSRVQTQTAQNAALATKAYALGEGALANTLLARRMALEATQAAETAQVDALEANARLLLDAHMIWSLPDDHAGHR